MEKFISYCLRKGWYGKRRVVCFALNGRRVVFIGHNSFCSSSRIQRTYAARNSSERKYRHAEAAALGGRLGRLGIIDGLVVVRLNARGEPVMAKPCEICQQIIKDYGVKNVEWTTGAFPSKA